MRKATWMRTTLRYSCATDPNPVAEIDPLTYHWFMGDKAGTNNPGEFVFIPNTADAAEDDGVLMGFVHDASTNRSDPLAARRRHPRDHRRDPPARARPARLPRQLVTRAASVWWTGEPTDHRHRPTRPVRSPPALEPRIGGNRRQ
jgi:hypothetical protein